MRLLTRREDAPRLARSSGVARLKEIAALDIVPIDDLVAPGFTPVTLTLAMHRGVAAGVVPGRARRFFLLNGDFALADSALAGALAAWTRGVKLLLAPSLRVTEESIAPPLQDLVAETGVLALPPRAMAALAFGALHHTVLSSRMDQQLLRSTNPHQLYWRIDRQTMIARGFCLFALGVEVDAPPPPAAAYCDYGMGALLTGGATPLVLGQSDDFLALEIAPARQEESFSVYGSPDLDAIARALQGWTTDFHRSQARAPIVIRSGESGVDLAIAQAEADRVVASILARLGPPQPVRDHPNWRGGVAGWRMRRREIGLLEEPPELAPLPTESGGQVRPRGALRRAMRWALLGTPDRRLPWHPFWALDRVLTDIALDALAWGEVIRTLGATQLSTFEPLAPFRRGAGRTPPGLLAVALDATRETTLDAHVAAARRAASSAARVALVAFRQDGAPLSPLDTARLYAAADDWLQIDRAELLALALDAAAERAYGGLADHASWRRPLSSLRRIASASPFPFLIAVANALRAWAPQLSRGGASVAVLVGRPRGAGMSAVD